MYKTIREYKTKTERMGKLLKAYKTEIKLKTNKRIHCASVKERKKLLVDLA